MISTLLLLASLTAPPATPELALAEGYVLQEVLADGTQVWSRPRYSLQCAGGSCGSGSQSQRGCASGNCGAGSGMNRGGPQPEKLRPIEKETSTLPITPAITQPAPLDYDKLAATLADKLASDSRFRGPPGEPGKDGAPGKDGVTPTVDYDKLAEALAVKLDYAKLAAHVKVNIPTQPTPSTERHIVVVADQQAGYWARLSGEIATAQQSYRGIEIAKTPPFDVGPMPQIIRYEGGIPKVLAQGTYAVSNVLSQIARGEFQ